VIPAYDLVLVVEADLDALRGEGTMHVLRDVVLAAPDHLDRCARHALGEERGLERHVPVGAPAEAAAEERPLDLHLVGLGAGRDRACQLHVDDRLVGGPKMHAVTFDQSGGVERLHAAMGDVVGDEVAGKHLLGLGDGALSVAILEHVDRLMRRIVGDLRICFGERIVAPFARWRGFGPGNPFAKPPAMLGRLKAVERILE
jgi:hypothetical protein